MVRASRSCSTSGALLVKANHKNRPSPARKRSTILRLGVQGGSSRRERRHRICGRRDRRDYGRPMGGRDNNVLLDWTAVASLAVTPRSKSATASWPIVRQARFARPSTRATRRAFRPPTTTTSAERLDELVISPRIGQEPLRSRQWRRPLLAALVVGARRGAAPSHGLG
jgi:hypothetical protein